MSCVLLIKDMQPAQSEECSIQSLGGPEDAPIPGSYVHGLFLEKSCRDQTRSLICRNSLRIYSPLLLQGVHLPCTTNKACFILLL
jgi:hypothetical protein